MPSSNCRGRYRIPFVGADDPLIRDLGLWLSKRFPEPFDVVREHSVLDFLAWVLTLGLYNASSSCVSYVRVDAQYFEFGVGDVERRKSTYVVNSRNQLPPQVSEAIRLASVECAVRSRSTKKLLASLQPFGNNLLTMR